MHSASFAELRSHLLARGIAPNHVRRITTELGDHLEDLRVAALESGLTPDDAMQRAKGQLGDQQIIAERMLQHTEFKTWVYRYPRVARIYLPVAYALLLPATPVFIGIRNPMLVVRWCAALMLSGAITAAMFLFMQLSIVLT
jgi:hypothetical protein